MAKEKKPRELTEKEKARIKRLEEKTAELAEQGYVREDVTISIVRANVMAIIWAIPFIVPFVIWFFSVHEFKNFELYELLILLVLMVVLIVVHELIHGVTWAMFAGDGFKSIEFGFMKESLTPYCTCMVPLRKGAYIAGSLMPFLILGILPSVVGCLIGSLPMLYIGAIMVLGAGGDLTITAKMLLYRNNGRENIIMDHPSECGFVVFKR